MNAVININAATLAAFKIKFIFYFAVAMESETEKPSQLISVMIASIKLPRHD